MNNRLLGHKGGPKEPYEESDNLRSTQRAEIVDVLSEGRIAGLVSGLKSVYLDGVPVENADGSRNFKDFAFTFHDGGTATPAPDAMGDVQTEVAVGVTVANALPVVRTVSDATVDSIRVTINVPVLVDQRSNGDRVGAAFDWAIDVQSNGGGFVERYLDRVSGKCSSPYQRAVRLNLRQFGPPPWDVRVRRISPDTSGAVLSAFSWASYTLISGVKLSYPHSAKFWMTFDAANFSAVPTRTYDAMGVDDWEIPVNYDPLARTFTGNWNGTFKLGWTNDPAWVLWNLIRHQRYGLGRYVSTPPDKWVLYLLSQWCSARVPDGKGGTEPRYSINAYLQQPVEALQLLQDICAVFRGVLHYGAGTLGAVWDQPGPPVATYTAANVVDGRFAYSDDSVSDKKSSCTCWYNDRTQFGKRMPASYTDDELVARYGLKEMEIEPIGCCSPGQALRATKWALYSQQHEDETVSFTVGAMGQLGRLGEVFQVLDPPESGERLAGRVRSATASAVTLDAPVVLAAGETYTLWAMLADAADTARIKLESRTVTNGAGSHQVLNVAPAFSAAPAAQTVWALDGSEVAPTLWRYESIAEQRDESGQVTYAVVGRRHYADKWALIEANTPLTIRPTRRLPSTTPPPLALKIDETVYLAGPLARIRATVSWQYPAAGLQYLLAWRLDGGTWASVPATSGNTVELDGLAGGLLEVRAQSISALGQRSAEVAESRLLLGRTAAPGNVGTLGWAAEEFGVRLRWTAVADSDGVYSMRYGPSWDAGTPLVDEVAGTDYLWRVQGSGARQVWIKALARTLGGITLASAVATGAEVQVPAPSGPALSYQIEGAFELVQLVLAAAAGQALDSAELYVGDSFAAASLIERVRGTRFRRRVDYMGARRYWVRVVDVAGTPSQPVALDVAIAAPGEVTSARTEVVDNNVLIYWGPPASGSLPVERYEVRKGATWAAAQPLGSNGNSTFAGVFEQAGGVYQYWVAAIDSAGNAGPPKAITATVAQPPDYVLRVSWDSSLAGTRTNLALDNGALVGPVDTSETWGSHFASRGWASPAAQVAAGFALYAQPSVTSASYDESFDYGAELPPTVVTVTPQVTVLAGAVTTSVQIYTRRLAGDPWTAAPAGPSALVTATFRYVRVVVTLSCTAGANLARIEALNVRLANKLRTDSGTFVVTDAVAGVWVPFNVSFVDADTPICQPGGTTPLLPVVDFADVVNPTGFRVYLYTTAGAKTTGSGAWTARGY